MGTTRGSTPRAHYRLEEFRLGEPQQGVSLLPVAVLPQRDGETHLVRRGKQRPCLVIANTEERVDPTLARGTRWQTALARLVVPYYSANGTSHRGGWPDELVARIQRCEYPQYVWDMLPLSGSPKGSILRLDHAFAIGHDLANVRLTPHQLHQDALGILDDWFAWYVTGTLSAAGALTTARELLREL